MRQHEKFLSVSKEIHNNVMDKIFGPTEFIVATGMLNPIGHAVELNQEVMWRVELNCDAVVRGHYERE